MVNLTHGFLSSVCITIPEFSFYVLMTIKMLKRNDMLDLFNLRENVISLLIIVAPPALLYDSLNYIIGTPQWINRAITMTILYLLMTYILNKRSIIEYPHLKKKAMAFLMFSLLMAIAIEIVTLPIIFKLTEKTYEVIRTDFYLVLLCSLASRIIQIAILVIVINSKNNKFQISIFDYIFKNRFFMTSTLTVIIGLIAFEAYFVKLILNNNLLTIVDTVYEQLFIVVAGSFLIPIAMILITYQWVNHTVMIINSEKQTFRID